MSPSRLPDQLVKLALVSGEFPAIGEGLKQLGVTPVETSSDPRLPVPVAHHPDMQACLLPDGPFVLRGSPLQSKLAAYGCQASETVACPEAKYPKDVLCNGFVWGNCLVGNPHTLDTGIQRAAQLQGLEMLAVRQGYAACSVALVDATSAITADIGMAKQLESHGFSILRIRTGFIRLPGYDTGFIGGCCGKLAPGLLAVSGSIGCHPDGEAIQRFVECRGVSIIELSQGPLIDIGGILPIL